DIALPAAEQVLFGMDRKTVGAAAIRARPGAIEAGGEFPSLALGPAVARRLQSFIAQGGEVIGKAHWKGFPSPISMSGTAAAKPSRKPSPLPRSYTMSRQRAKASAGTEIFISLIKRAMVIRPAPPGGRRRRAADRRQH